MRNRRVEGREAPKGILRSPEIVGLIASICLTSYAATLPVHGESQPTTDNVLMSEEVEGYDYFFDPDTNCVLDIELEYYDNLSKAHELIDQHEIAQTGLERARADVLIQNIDQASKISVVHHILKSAFEGKGIEIVFELDGFEAEHKPYSSAPMTLEDAKMAAKTAIEFLALSPAEILRGDVVSTIYIAKDIRYEVTDPETTDEKYLGAGGVSYSSGDLEKGGLLIIAANVDVDTYFHEYTHAIINYARLKQDFDNFDFECIKAQGYGYQGSFVNNLPANDPVRLKMEATIGVYETIYGSTNLNEDMATIGTVFRHESISLGANEVDDNPLNAKRAKILNVIYDVFGPRAFIYFVDVQTAYAKGPLVIE